MVNLLVCRKKFYLTLFFIMLGHSVFSQNSVTLVFTGISEQGSYVRMNSVTIENLSKGWSETIYFPDTTYIMNLGAGVKDFQQGKDMQVMPNPFEGSTRLNVFSAKDEEAKMVISDINGRKCAEYTGRFISGDNYFDISLTTPQTYILSIQTASGISSLKMVNTGHAGSNSITYSSNSAKTVKVDIKSHSTYEFDLGDEMQYTGYAQIENQTVQSFPFRQRQYSSEDITLVFEDYSLNVTTNSVVFLNSTTMACYGMVYSSGLEVMNTGFCWSPSPSPTVAGNHTEEGPEEGAFTSVISGINPTLGIYVRAYALNSIDTVYGDELFCPASSFIINDTVFLPDGVDCGNGCAYESSVNVTGYATSDIIASEDDIKYVRIQMEHSFIGDLYIALSCPNGQTVKIMNKYGTSGMTSCSSQIPTPWGWQVTSGVSSGANFGVAYDYSNGCDPNDSQNQMGQTWNYCWSNNTALGYQYANGSGYVYENVNINVGMVDSTNTINMTQVYHPDQPFSQLVGCPINGTWSINVIDGWGADNGWLTEWELAFNREMQGVVNVVQPCHGITSVTDYDGNVYHTIAIGSQCWLRENMQTTHYSSGDAITLSNGTSTNTAYYYLPENTSSDAGLAGYLYNWVAVMNHGNPAETGLAYIQGVCPEGWHVPSNEEWIKLQTFLNSRDEYVCGNNWGNIAKSLAINTTWDVSSNFCAVGSDLWLNNSTGFTAFPVGYAQGNSMDYGRSARFWSSTQYDDVFAYYCMLNYDNSSLIRSNYGEKTFGMSVRCVLAEAPKVIISTISNITDTSAIGNGEVLDTGGAPVIEKGLCWSTGHFPTFADYHVACGNGIGSFSGLMNGLTMGTTYFVRAYSINMVDTSYSNPITFVTLNKPTVITAAVTNITESTAFSGGNIIFDGGASITARGVCWSTSQNPTINDSHTIDGNGTGSFTSSMTGLAHGTTYYVRAYATNILGTGYGNQVTFVMVDVPTVITNVVSFLDSSAICGGNVISNGGDSVPLLAKGICWSTTQNPTINDSMIEDTSAQTNFTCVMTGLLPGTTYYVRAYATNFVGTSYGNEIIFTTLRSCSGASTVSDYDGNSYNTVQIGNQCWMKENLRTTHYANGESIALGSSTSTIIAYRYYPHNNNSNVSVYGYLYNWPAVMYGASSSASNPSSVQGICPNGWHVPSDAEWTQLTDYVSSQTQYLCNNSVDNIAKTLAFFTGWNYSSNTCAVGNNQSSNNATGFSALPAGYYFIGSDCFGSRAYFWSATEYNGFSYHRALYYDNASVERVYGSKFAGKSVRCLRD